MISLKRIGSALVVLLGLSAFVDAFFSFGESASRLVPYAFKGLLILLILAVIVYFLSQRVVPVQVNILFPLLFTILALMSTGVFYAKDPVNPTDLARVFLWILTFFAVYLLRQADCLDEGLLRLAVVCDVGWICLRILAFKLFHVWIGAETPFGPVGECSSMCYFLIWFVPLLLMLQTRHVFPLMLLIFFTMVSAFKRGALLGLILGFVAYYLLSRRTRRERWNPFQDLAKLLPILVLAGGGFLMFKEHITGHMADLSGGQGLGSGRQIFYQIILRRWMDFDWPDKLFGAGFFQVEPMLSLYYFSGVPAHSDWLETLYDEGLFGLGLLVLVHLLLIYMTLNAAGKRRAYAPAMAYAYVVFLLSGIYSTTFYSFDTTWFGVAMGYCLGTGVLEARRERESLRPPSEPSGAAAPLPSGAAP